MRRRRLVLLAGLLALAGAVAVAVAMSPAVRRAPAEPAASASAAVPVGTQALRVLHGWDERRARAWSEGSIRALGALYATGSQSGAADRAMLRTYRDRGLRVIGMRRQVLGVRVLDASRGALTLRVTDRLQRSVAVGPGVRRRLPQGGWSTACLTFRRTERGWVLVG